MSNVLRQIALVHASRLEKKDKERLRQKFKTVSRQAYFRDSGVPEMWDEVKDISISNPVPEIIEGLTIPFNALLIPTDHDMLEKAGLALYDKNGGESHWYVSDCSNKDDEKPQLYYHWSGKSSGCMKVDAPEAKQKFVQAFVNWLSRFITPQMLAEMDVDMSAPLEPKKPNRKFLQVAE
jgi:hypothetical protein